MTAKTGYREAEAYLEQVPLFARKNTPAKTAAFYAYLTGRLPLPERTRIIHVAGTNGKGSVCAYLDSILREAGFRVGMFTSPHLVEIRERFRIDGQTVGEEEFADAFRAVRGFVEDYRREHDPGYHPSYFEYLFFMIFPIYREYPLDYLIVETGLGGRLDTTNLFPHPAVCVITRIGFDHTQCLGDTIAAIAGEKAGIIKRGTPVTYLEDCPEADDVIRRKAAECGVKAYSVSKQDYAILSFGDKTIDFSYTSRYYGYIEAVLSTVARYQAENASLAVCAVEAMGMAPRIGAEQVCRGLRKAFWAGRMEEVLPDVYVDGAHNEDGIGAFLDCVRRDGREGGRMLLFSAVSDKRVDAMVRMLQQGARFERVVAVRLRSERGVAPECLVRLFEEARAAGQRISGTEDMEAAFREAVAWSRRGGNVVYVVGSLYLVGQVKELVGEYV